MSRLNSVENPRRKLIVGGIALGLAVIAFASGLVYGIRTRVDGIMTPTSTPGWVAPPTETPTPRHILPDGPIKRA